MPSTGKLFKHRVPTGDGIRVDSGVEEGQEITINYDPMISKLTVHGKNRQAAINKMLRALDEYEIVGCKTTIPFCEYTLRHESFVEAKYDTHFVKDHFNPEDTQSKVNENIIALAATLLKNTESSTTEAITSENSASDWWLNRR